MRPLGVKASKETAGNTAFYQGYLEQQSCSRSIQVDILELPHPESGFFGNGFEGGAQRLKPELSLDLDMRITTVHMDLF